MTLEIYVNQLLWLLAVPFYNEFLVKIRQIIYIDDNIVYHTSKQTKKFCAEVGLLHMMWLAQFVDLNPIDNTRRISKIRISSYYHRIYSIGEIKVAIIEKMAQVDRERL